MPKQLPVPARTITWQVAAGSISSGSSRTSVIVRLALFRGGGQDLYFRSACLRLWAAAAFSRRILQPQLTNFRYI
jgi:hypothetical protein